MKHRLFSHNPSTQGFSVAVSASLVLLILSICKNTFLLPHLERLFSPLRKHFSREVSEFGEKFSPLVMNKRLENKVLLGAKIIFYYEDENEE